MAKPTETVLVKKPHTATAFTQAQIQEFVKCADPITGPEYFMRNYFYIQHPTQGKLLFDPYDYQIGLIQTYNRYRFSINLLSRQLGKTTCASGYLLWYAMFIKDSTILIAAHKYTGAQEIMQRIRYAYELCPDYIRAGATNYNKGSIEFDNSSRIVSSTTTETTGRGMSISLLYSDEMAYVRPTIAKEFWTSISPTLATGGKCIITSTPNSDEDQFALLWHGANKTIDEYGNETELGRNGFKAYSALWHQHPERDAVWEKEQRAALGDLRFDREMNCMFVQDEETLISPDVLLTLDGIEPIERHGQVRWYKKPEPHCTYVLALDPSLGTGGDPAAIQIFELPTFIQVGEWQHNRTPIQRQINILTEITRYLADVVPVNSIYYSVENNSIGEAALISIAEIGEENIKGTFLSEPTRRGATRRYRKGFNTTHSSKIAACAKLKNLVESRRLKINSKNLISEFKNFVSHGLSYAAKPGETDDLVMSLILIVRIAQLLQSYDPNLDNVMKDSLEEIIPPMPFIMLR